MNELYDIFQRHNGRIIHKFAHYFGPYERHLSRYRNTACTFVEIGAGEGGSGQMWKQWLGPQAQIVLLDNRPECLEYEEPQIAVRIGDQANLDFLTAVCDEFGPPDVVLDDGSHKQGDLLASFMFLYPLLSSNGCYIAEDLHTAYMERYGGGLNRYGTFIEFAKGLIDELNADWIEGHGNVATTFTRYTTGMSFYDSMCIFDRGVTTFPKVAEKHGAGL